MSSPVAIIAGREIGELWLGRRGLALLLGFSVLLSAITYLTATNQVLNFLEQREAVGLLLQLAIAVGTLVTMLLGADAISGERERATLESLLLTPVSGASVLFGKLFAALSWWAAAFALTVPYVWVLGRGVYVAGPALLIGGLAGTLLATALTGLGLVISGRATSNRVSLATSLLVLLALFAPTQLPAGLPANWFGDLLTRVNPIGATVQYLSSVVVNDRGWTADLSYLLAPALLAALTLTALGTAGDRLVQLAPGGGQ